jgi:hypothetical protein
MTWELPIWMQDQDYAARLDRGLVEAFGSEGVINDLGGNLKVTERGAGPNFSIDIATGAGIVAGDDQANQGSYFVRNTATLNVAVGAPDPSNPRIDAVVVQVRDTQAGGEAGTICEARVLPGGAAPVPVAPTIPATCMLLAYIAVPVGLSAVTNSQITDERVLARTTIVVSATEPTDPIEGLVWFQPS